MPHQTTAERRRAREGTERERLLELEREVKRRFSKVNTVSCSRPFPITITLASQFHVNLLWGQRPFSVVS